MFELWPHICKSIKSHVLSVHSSALLLIVLFLMLSSTAYDIFYTASNRKFNWFSCLFVIYKLYTESEKKSCNYLSSWVLLVFVHCRYEVSSTRGIFRVFEWSEITRIQTGKISWYDALFTWHPCDINDVGSAYSRILHVCHLTDSQQSHVDNGLYSKSRNWIKLFICFYATIWNSSSLQNTTTW